MSPSVRSKNVSAFRWGEGHENVRTLCTPTGCVPETSGPGGQQCRRVRESVLSLGDKMRKGRWGRA